MKFTDEQKKSIVARREKGESICALCSEYSVPCSTLYRWCKIYKAHIISDDIRFTVREVLQMQNRITKLNKIIEILKSVNCTVSAPL